MAGEEPGTGSADVCELLQPAQGPGVTGALPAESEEEVELANTKSVKSQVEAAVHQLSLTQNMGDNKGELVPSKTNLENSVQRNSRGLTRSIFIALSVRNSPLPMSLACDCGR